MARLFRGYEDALARTVEIADAAGSISRSSNTSTRRFRSRSGMTPQERLAQLAWEGAARKFAKNASPPDGGRGRGPIAVAMGG